MTNHSHGKLNTALPSNVHVGAIRSDNSSPITPEGAIDPGFNFDYNKNSLNRIASLVHLHLVVQTGVLQLHRQKKQDTKYTGTGTTTGTYNYNRELISEPSSQSAIKPLPSSQIVQPIKITGTGSANSSRRGSLKKSIKQLYHPHWSTSSISTILSKQDDGNFIFYWLVLVR